MPPIRSTADRATLVDLVLPVVPDVTTITGYPFTPERSINDEMSDWAARGTHKAFDDHALAQVLQEIDGLRRDTAARDALEAAIDTVIRPAIADATRAGLGVLIAYGPDECVARPSNAVHPGQALLLRTDRLRVDNPLPPIAFRGANA